MRRLPLRSLLAFGAVAVALSAAPWARADEVVLEDGQIVDGVVSTEGNLVHVRLDYGTITFKKSEVKEIRKKDSALVELDRRRAALDTRDATAVRTLAAWADDQGLASQARALYRVLIGLQPDDAVARERLGYRQREGKWLTEDEYMLAEGYVRYDGGWRTPKEVEVLESTRAARLAESSRRDAEKKTAARAEEKEAESEAAASTEDSTLIIQNGWVVWPRRVVRPRSRGTKPGKVATAPARTPPKTPVRPPPSKKVRVAP